MLAVEIRIDIFKNKQQSLSKLNVKYSFLETKHSKFMEGVIINVGYHLTILSKNVQYDNCCGMCMMLCMHTLKE